ncbi:MAG: hypothetical protein ACAF42_14605 [Limnothrix sp. BL-A-16]
MLIRDPNEAAIDLSRSLRPAMCRAGADRAFRQSLGCRCETVIGHQRTIRVTLLKD